MDWLRNKLVTQNLQGNLTVISVFKTGEFCPPVALNCGQHFDWAEIACLEMHPFMNAINCLKVCRKFTPADLPQTSAHKVVKIHHKLLSVSQLVVIPSPVISPISGLKSCTWYFILCTPTLDNIQLYFFLVQQKSQYSVCFAFFFFMLQPIKYLVTIKMFIIRKLQIIQ